MIAGVGVGTIASIVLALIQFGLKWFEGRQDEILRQAGENREKLRQYTALTELSSKLKEVDERYTRMSDDEIKTDIASKGDFRD